MKVVLIQVGLISAGMRFKCWSRATLQQQQANSAAPVVYRHSQAPPNLRYCVLLSLAHLFLHRVHPSPAANSFLGIFLAFQFLLVLFKFNYRGRVCAHRNILLPAWVRALRPCSSQSPVSVCALTCAFCAAQFFLTMLEVRSLDFNRGHDLTWGFVSMPLSAQAPGIV